MNYIRRNLPNMVLGAVAGFILAVVYLAAVSLSMNVVYVPSSNLKVNSRASTGVHDMGMEYLQGNDTPVQLQSTMGYRQIQ